MNPRMSVNKTAVAEKEDPVTIESDADFDLGQEYGKVTPEELDDFLAADAMEVRADPIFKEELRQKLWTMVSEQYGRDEGPDSQG